jgi:hypothetical protein
VRFAVSSGRALALLAAILTTWAPVSIEVWTPARAQQQPRLVINVAPITLVEPASTTPLAIQIGPQEALSKNSFVRIRGLPPSAALSEGHAISPGAWAIPLVALPTLNIVVPVGLQGRWNVTVAVVSIEGVVLTEAKSALVVGPMQLIVGPQPKQDGQQKSVASIGPVTPALPSPERERALSLHEKGQELLEQGNIYPARMFFKRAAEAGLAQSALALAATYDPNELAKLKVVGLKSDVAAARRWYEKARELGATEAAARLQRLEGR